jgi:hypothetical protein
MLLCTSRADDRIHDDRDTGPASVFGDDGSSDSMLTSRDAGPRRGVQNRAVASGCLRADGRGHRLRTEGWTPAAQGVRPSPLQNGCRQPTS